MRSYIFKFLIALLLVLFFAFLYKIYIPRINAFGCFDDCFNLMGGYFLNYGLRIFSDFYFNHQPGMAYISALIQYASEPQSIAELILRHRQFMLISSCAFSLLLYFRFGLRMVVVVVLYELTKFYVFGDRFLAEGLVAYLIAYQLGVMLELQIIKKARSIDIYLMPIFTWLVVFLREPYLLATLFFFVMYLIAIFKKSKLFLFSLGIFLIPTIVTVLLNSPKDYFFNLITVNKSILTSDALNETPLVKLAKIVFYPLYFTFSKEGWTILRTFTALISIAYAFGTVYVAIFLKKWKFAGTTLIALILVNLRPGPADVQFFEAFNLAVWLMSILIITIFLIAFIFKKAKREALFISSFIFIAFITLILNKSYFAYEKVDTHEEFFTKFSYVMDVGTTIRNLSESNDTLFVDGYDDLIIWEAKLKSPYQYTWYTSFMPNFDKYTHARVEMFKINPPDFYYGKCLKTLYGQRFTAEESFSAQYLQLSSINEKSCILIHKDKVGEITKDKWEKINKAKYFLQD